MNFTITKLAFGAWVQGLALAPDGSLWGVFYRDRVVRSTDGGSTWAEVTSPAKKWLTALAVAPDGAVLVGDEKGALHESRDGGHRWEHTPLRGSKHLWAMLVTPDAVLASVGSNIYRRPHGETAWMPAKKGPRGFTVRRLSRLDDGALFAYCAETTTTRAAWRSRDGGDTWERLLAERGNDLYALHASGGRVYGPLASGGLLTSDDGGETWRHRPLPFRAEGLRLWSAGLVLYAFDVPHRPATEEIGEVWRSPDGGETWSCQGAYPLAVRSTECSAQGDVTVGGCVGDRCAIARWRDAAAGSFFAARAIAPREKVASARAPTKPSSPEAAMLDRVLAAWRARRHPRFAKLIERLGARAETTPPVGQAAWMALAKAKRAEDVDALVATWRDGTMDEVRLRFDALAAYADDPRVAMALAGFVGDFAYGATSSKPLWGAVGAKLVALRHPRTVAVVDGAAGAAIPVSGATMKAWLGGFLPKLAGQLTTACGKAKPLDDAERALCEEAETLLG